MRRNVIVPEFVKVYFCKFGGFEKQHGYCTTKLCTFQESEAEKNQKYDNFCDLEKYTFPNSRSPRMSKTVDVIGDGTVGFLPCDGFCEPGAFI